MSSSSRFIAGSMLRIKPRLPAIIAAASVACVGCQSFAPRSLTAAREEKKVVKQAQNDPFPSPGDVGLEKPTTTP